MSKYRSPSRGGSDRHAEWQRMKTALSRLPAWSRMPGDDRKLFVRLHVEATTHRDARYFASQRARWGEWCTQGAVGLFGLLVLGWSGDTAALLLFAAFWLNWLTDMAQWALHRRELAQAALHEDERAHYWQLVAFLRGRWRETPQYARGPALVAGLVIDVFWGAVATVLFAFGLRAAQVDAARLLASASLWIGALLLLVSMLPTLPARLRPGAHRTLALPQFRYGQRGIGLCLLVFGLMAVGGGRLGGSVLVGCVDGFALLVGLVNLTWGVRSERADLAWIEQQTAAIGGAPSATAGKTGASTAAR